MMANQDGELVWGFLRGGRDDSICPRLVFAGVACVLEG